MATPATSATLPGWERARDCSISMHAANLLALLLLVPIAVVLIGTYAAFWGRDSLVAGLQGIDLWAALPAFLLATALHEAIHGVTWALFSGKPVGVIRYGFNIATLTPFAHCREPLPVRAYMAGALMPGLTLGLLPWGVAMLGGFVMTAVAGGDMVVAWLLRNVGPCSLVQDHPSRAGCRVLDDPAGG